MRMLALIADAIVANVIRGATADFPDAIDITDLMPRPGPGWMFDGVTFAPPAPLLAPVAARLVTRLAFRNRFTQAELVTLEIASLDDPTAAMPERQQAAGIRVMMASLATATFVDLDRPDTRAGVQQLEAGGLIAVGRAAQILDAPVAPAEIPVGL